MLLLWFILVVNVRPLSVSLLLIVLIFRIALWPFVRKELSACFSLVFKVTFIAISMQYFDKGISENFLCSLSGCLPKTILFVQTLKLFGCRGNRKPEFV